MPYTIVPVNQSLSVSAIESPTYSSASERTQYVNMRGDELGRMADYAYRSAVLHCSLASGSPTLKLIFMSHQKYTRR